MPDLRYGGPSLWRAGTVFWSFCINKLLFCSVFRTVRSAFYFPHSAIPHFTDTPFTSKSTIRWCVPAHLLTSPTISQRTHYIVYKKHQLLTINCLRFKYTSTVEYIWSTPEFFISNAKKYVSNYPTSQIIAHNTCRIFNKTSPQNRVEQINK